MTVNASFVSPTADANVAHMLQHFDSNGLVSSIVAGFTVWKLILTLLLTAIAYDQCTPLPMLHVGTGAKHRSLCCSQIHMEQGLNCRTGAEDALHRSFPRISEPRLHKVPREMVLGTPQLCLRFPQVCAQLCCAERYGQRVCTLRMLTRDAGSS